MNDAFTRLLRWSERYTKTDMVYLVKNFGWAFFGQLALSVSAFLTTIFLANFLSKDVYGTYRYLISVAVTLSIFTLPGIGAALTQSVAKGYDGQLRFATRTRILYGLLASILALIMSVYYFLQDNNLLGTAMISLAALAPFFTSFQNFTFYLQGKQKFRKSAVLQYYSLPLTLITIIIIAFTYPHPIALIVGFILSQTITQYVGYHFSLREEDSHAKQDVDLIKYGKYLTVHNIFPITLATQIGTLATWYLLGDTAAATYAIATLFYNEFMRIAGLITQVIVPKMSSQEINIFALFQKTFLLVTACFCCWLLYSLCAPLIFQIILPGYTDVVWYSIVAMFGIVFIPRLVLQGWLLANKFSKELAHVSWATAFVQILTTATLTYYYGFIGTLAALLISPLFECLMTIFVIYRSIQVSKIDLQK